LLLRRQRSGQSQFEASLGKDPISKIPITKMAGRVALGIGPELKSQYHKKKKKEKKKTVFFMGCIPHLFIL
jgi:hypothetical protein